MVPKGTFGVVLLVKRFILLTSPPFSERKSVIRTHKGTGAVRNRDKTSNQNSVDERNPSAPAYIGREDRNNYIRCLLWTVMQAKGNTHQQKKHLYMGS